MRTNDFLLQKAIDGEAMSESELRDFGAAMVKDVYLAEEFVAMKRIVRDATHLMGDSPSAEFADRVMAALEEAPLPQRAQDRSIFWNLAAASALIAGAATFIIYNGFYFDVSILSSWTGSLGWPQSLSEGWQFLLNPIQLLAGGLDAIVSAQGYVVWMSALGLAAMVGLNALLARNMKQHIRE